MVRRWLVKHPRVISTSPRRARHASTWWSVGSRLSPTSSCDTERIAVRRPSRTRSARMSRSPTRQRSRSSGAGPPTRSSSGFIGGLLTQDTRRDRPPGRAVVVPGAGTDLPHRFVWTSAPLGRRVVDDAVHWASPDTQPTHRNDHDLVSYTCERTSCRRCRDQKQRCQYCCCLECRTRSRPAPH